VKKRIANMPTSVHARLLNRSRSEGRPFNELLQYYAMERFLYRLSRSEHADRFVLKGALMLQLWRLVFTRATKDIDLLGRTATNVEELVEVVRRFLSVEVDDDGLRFNAATVSGEPIRLHAHYDGVRIRCGANLGNARISLQVDVGFGDVITPGPQKIHYPALLDFDPPRLLGYTPETTIAEKFQTMVVLDMANTRLKDFLDIWGLAQRREFTGALLAGAVAATFRRRKTPLPQSTPLALTRAFHSSPVKKAQWAAYLRKGRLDTAIPPLDQVAIAIHGFLEPVIVALAKGTAFTEHWPPGGPWKVSSASEHER